MLCKFKMGEVLKEVNHGVFYFTVVFVSVLEHDSRTPRYCSIYENYMINNCNSGFPVLLFFCQISQFWLFRKWFGLKNFGLAYA